MSAGRPAPPGLPVERKGEEVRLCVWGLIGRATALPLTLPGLRISVGRARQFVHNRAVIRNSGRNMPQLTRITRDPTVMGGKPCIRGMRVTVGTVVGLVAAGRTRDEILREYPYLEAEDIAEALSYAAWRAEEVEVPLRRP